MGALYDALDSLGGFSDHIQVSALYPVVLFVTGSDPQYLGVAPWDGEILGVALVNQRAITGSQSTVDFELVGGGANPFAQLNTGDNNRGSADTLTFSTPIPILAGEVILGQSDGNATGNSEVMLFVSLRST